ncbi:MAG: hypothetical protein IPK94_10265 [Saprospiraceae bacterium]|nr:hypothetical protein [Saprospiraceae bacterium]
MPGPGILQYDHNDQKRKNLLEAKSDFIQNMTHELKTPISTVRVALEALPQSLMESMMSPKGMIT